MQKDLERGRGMSYEIELAKRILFMLQENERASEIYKNTKLTSFTENRERYYEDLKKMTKEQKTIYWKSGVLYSKSAIKRVRIELNKSLIEREKAYE